MLLARVGGPGGGRFSQLWPGGYGRADREIALRSLAEVEALDLARRRIGSLSGGQLQRVLLARALACEPRILFWTSPRPTSTSAWRATSSTCCGNSTPA